MLTKTFLKAVLLTEQGLLEDRNSGTPQGAILSPLLANIALSPLDDRLDEKWQAVGDRSARSRLRRKGHATYRLVRYADDFVVLVAGQRHHAEASKDEAAAVLAPMGLKLSAHKTHITHWTKGSISWGSGSAGTQNGERTPSTSTPTPPRQPWRRSRRR